MCSVTKYSKLINMLKPQFPRYCCNSIYYGNVYCISAKEPKKQLILWWPCNFITGFSLEGGTRVPVPGYTRVSFAYFQTEHKEIHLKCNFLPSYSPKDAPLLQNLMKPPELVLPSWSLLETNANCTHSGLLVACEHKQISCCRFSPPKK